MSKYDMWMEITKRRKGISDKTLTKWPRKIRFNDKNL